MYQKETENELATLIKTQIIMLLNMVQQRLTKLASNCIIHFDYNQLICFLYLNYKNTEKVSFLSNIQDNVIGFVYCRCTFV